MRFNGAASIRGPVGIATAGSIEVLQALTNTSRPWRGGRMGAHKRGRRSI